MEKLIQKYDLLFSLKTSPYISIYPTEESKRLTIKKHFIVKQHDNEIKLIAEITESKKGTKTIKETRYETNKTDHYTFYVQMNDRSFFNYEKVDMKGFPNTIFFFNNYTDSSNLKMEKIPVYSGMIEKQLTKNKLPVAIKILNSQATEIYKHKPDSEFFSYDPSGNESGVYTIVMEYAKSTDNVTEVFFYKKNEFINKVIGVIDITSIDSKVLEKEDGFKFEIFNGKK